MTASARLSIALALGLTAYFWWQGERFLDANGPTFDECAHLASGYGYWSTGSFQMNHEHPPLLKMWWALPLVLGDRPTYPRDLAVATNFDHWPVGIAFLYDSGFEHQRLLKPARRMNMVLGCSIVLLAGWWAYRLWNSRLAGLAASAFAAFDPNLLALSCVLTTDAGFAFFALLSCYLLWEYAATPTRPLLYAAGISLGLMLGSKLSAIAMVAGLGVAAFVHLRRGGTLALPGATNSRYRAAIDLTFRLGVIALITLAATYGFLHFDEWGRGLKYQLTRAEHGDGRMYLNGELSKTGWYHYFLVALAVKLPLGLFAATLGSLTVVGNSKRLLLFAIPPLVFFIAASASRVDLGIRVILPAIVFLYVFAGGVATPGRFRLVRLAVLALCLGWSGFTSWNASPNQIAYFNEIVGERGASFVADSNADWGQGLPQLKDYLKREELDVIYLSYFGTDIPEFYGIRFQQLPGYGRIVPPSRDAVPPDAPRHVLAISVNNLLGIYLPDPETFAFLRSRPPTAILAGCIIIFDLTGDAEAIRRVRSIPSP